jgi:hypothetical protein
MSRETRASSSTHDASATVTAPNGLAGCNCTNCGRFTVFKVIQSNANGNRGRLMATVRVYDHSSEF